MTATDWTTDTAGTGTYADVNGIRLYYETHGRAGLRPLILLHGGLGSAEMFGPVLPALAAGHQVIAVDLQGHGRTADIDRPIDVRLMADDIAALINHLGLEKPDLVGYSLGGGVAFFTAVKYPELIRKLVMVSANMSRNAIYPDMLAQQLQVGPEAAAFMKDTPMWKLYERVAPRPEDFPRLLGKMGASMAKDFDWSDEVRRLKVPTLIVAADADMAPPSHYVEVYKLLDGGLRDGGWMGEGRPTGGHALAILPGLTHYDIGASPLLAETARRSWTSKETDVNFNNILVGSEDPQRLVDYYTKLFGKPVMEEGGYAGWQIGAGFVAVGPHSEVHGKNSQPGRLIWNIETADVQGEFERLKAAGAVVVREPYSFEEMPDAAGMLIATLADPDDNYFQLMSPMPAGGPGSGDTT